MRYVGQAYPAVGNARLVAGRGTYVDDLLLPGLAHLAVLRSPYAHARIRSIDTREAEGLPGVVCVLTGEDVRQAMNPMPAGWDNSLVGARMVEWYALAPERVRFAGEPVVAVLAEDRPTAYQALTRIEVDYDELPAVVDPEEAMRPESPLVEPAWGDNVFISQDDCAGDPDGAFAEADGVVSGVARSRRITGVPLEPRGVVASTDPATDQLTVWSSTQNPFALRTFLAETLGLPETSLRVVQPQVGGAFGLKVPISPEETLVAYLSRKLGRPVKWIETRSENLLACGHARDTKLSYEAAFKRDGTVTGLRVKIIADVGAPTGCPGWGMAFVTAHCLPGSYKVPNVRVQLALVATNKCPWKAYRGFGKDAASFLMERIMDHVARATGMDRVAVRLRNFIQPEEFPYRQVSGAVLDSGNYPKAFERLLAMVDYANFPKLQAKARKEGRYLGLGIAQELTPEGYAQPGSVMNNGYDGASVRVSPSGDVTVLAGVTSPGNGNETALAQIAADTLGCDLGDVKVILGDTSTCPWGLGNYSSRSVMIGGSAVQLAAADVRQKVLKVASKMLEASPEDLDAEGGRIFVKGTPSRFVHLGDVATQVYRHPFGPSARDVEPGLEATRYFRMNNISHQPDASGHLSTYPTWPHAAVGCVVEVDPETGLVKILRYCLVDDAGTIVNPLLAEASLHGGIAQGVGSTLYERIVYDEAGQLQTTTFMDYTIPTAVELPAFEIEHQVSPSPFTPLGTKGVGESGLGGALGALASAIENALPHLDLHLTELPLTPDRLWRAIREGEGRSPTP